MCLLPVLPFVASRIWNQPKDIWSPWHKGNQVRCWPGSQPTWALVALQLPLTLGTSVNICELQYPTYFSWVTLGSFKQIYISTPFSFWKGFEQLASEREETCLVLSLFNQQTHKWLNGLECFRSLIRAFQEASEQQPLYPVFAFSPVTASIIREGRIFFLSSLGVSWRIFCLESSYQDRGQKQRGILESGN